MAGMYSVCMNFLIRMILLVVVMIVWQVVPSVTILFFPLAMVGLILCGFAIGMWLIPIGGLYGDVARGVPVMAQLWMLLTPVVYPARNEGLAGWLATWNPISPLIVTARATLTGQPLEQIPAAIAVSLLALCITLLGLFTFRLIMPHLIVRMGG
jgi:lipopolysaccharide transport system permease protein